MARPKSTAPTKVKLNLSVMAQTKAELAYISEIEGASISELVAIWASKQAKKLAKTTGKAVPDVNQIELDEFLSTGKEQQ